MRPTRSDPSAIRLCSSSSVAGSPAVEIHGPGGSSTERSSACSHQRCSPEPSRWRGEDSKRSPLHPWIERRSGREALPAMLERAEAPHEAFVQICVGRRPAWWAFIQICVGRRPAWWAFRSDLRWAQACLASVRSVLRRARACLASVRSGLRCWRGWVPGLRSGLRWAGARLVSLCSASRWAWACCRDPLPPTVVRLPSPTDNKSRMNTI